MEIKVAVKEGMVLMVNKVLMGMLMGKGKWLEKRNSKMAKLVEPRKKK